MKKIATEEHYYSQYFVDYFQSRKKYPRIEIVVDKVGREVLRRWDSAQEYHSFMPVEVANKLCDSGEGRLRDMDEVGIDMQVLSFPMPIYDFDTAEGTTVISKVNDAIGAAVREHPDRFAGFAALFLKDPDAAADELERAVKQLGLKGTLVLPHVEGEYIDAKKYWPVFETAARLGVPVYIHPDSPSPDRLKQYSDYPELVGAMWGYAAETGLAAMRLICSGIFDEYPGLQIILGHMGEALPYWLWRMDNSWRGRPGLARKLKKAPSEYIKNNFFITTSGMLWLPALLCSYLALGADRILFAVDYPFGLGKETVQFIESAPICDSDKEKICHSNVEKLLKLV